jgi:hypothetical protein
MKKEFVTYKPALALRELGFDEPCLAWYHPNEGFYLRVEGENINSKLIKKSCTAPLKQQAFRWFREKDYYSEIRVGCTQIDGGIGYEWWIWKPNGIEEWSIQIPGEEWSYETYEEAEQACLDKLIEIVRNTKS